MTKEFYVALYGMERWLKRNEENKAYYRANKERILAQAKERYRNKKKG